MKKLLIFVFLIAIMATGLFFYRRNTVMISDSGRKAETSSDSLFGDLVDVTGGNSNGVGYILRENNQLFHFVEADLPDLDEGLVYEGWLVKKKPKLEFFSTGVMEKDGEIYVLEYETDQAYRGYDDVVITLETKVDTTPEKHILEGLAR